MSEQMDTQECRSSTAAHTPGPWVAVHEPGSIHDDWADNGGYRIDAPSDRVEQLAFVWCLNKRVPADGRPQSDGPNFGDVRAGANARLIAAAPDMAEAIKTAVHECLEPEHQGGVIMPAWVFDKLRAAIAKAEGRS